MTSPDTHAEFDSLAEQYFREDDSERAAFLLERLLAEYCAPLIRNITGPKLRRSQETAQDVEDVTSESLLRLIEKLEEVRASATGIVGSVSRYTAIVAYNACHDYFRSKFPQRHRLRNRLRYLLKPERGFALWEGPHGEWICGLLRWRDSGMASNALPASPPSGAAFMNPADLLSTLFQAVGAPVDFDALVDFLAPLWGVKDGVVQVDSKVAPIAAPQLAPAFAAEELNIRSRLEELWSQICALPHPQRTALLLNLRGQDEACALELFSSTGTASMRQIAESLDISPQEFAAIWSKLPLDDLSIADRLKVTRQQVINLRKSARKRLDRRMTVIESHNPRRST